MSVDRRRFLNGAAGAIVGCTLGRLGIAEADEARSGRTPITRKEWDTIVRNAGNATLTCVRTPEVVEGPFYYESSLEGRAIAEKHAGEPLRLCNTLAGLVPGAGSGRCMPLAGAVMDVWHSDATGLYSNVGTDLGDRGGGGSGHRSPAHHAHPREGVSWSRGAHGTTVSTGRADR